MLRDNGVNIYSTGGETADVGDLVRTIIVDSTVTCRMKRADVIDNANIQPGDVIVGMSSYGQVFVLRRFLQFVCAWSCAFLSFCACACGLLFFWTCVGILPHADLTVCISGGGRTTWRGEANLL